MKKSSKSSSAQSPKNSESILLWLKIIRPQTLFASLCPVLVGLIVTKMNIGLASKQSILVAVLTVVCALALQILSNLINDYYDFVRGADQKGRVGFSRALSDGLVSTEQMRTACLITLCLVVLTGAVLSYVGGWMILLIGLTAILFAWLYTATDYSLSYLGIADIFVFLYYGVIATIGTVWLQYKAVGLVISWANFNMLETPFYAGAVCGLISMCVLAINNIRDIEDDQKVGKRTFAVRFGKKTALVGFGVIVALMPICAFLAFGMNLPILIVIPAIYLFYRVLRASGKEYNKCLMMAGLVNLCYAVLVWLMLI